MHYHVASIGRSISSMLLTPVSTIVTVKLLAESLAHDRRSYAMPRGHLFWDADSQEQDHGRLHSGDFLQDGDLDAGELS